MTWPISSIGWALFLPLALAAVAVLATAAGDGPELARVIERKLRRLASGFLRWAPAACFSGAAAIGIFLLWLGWR